MCSSLSSMYWNLPFLLNTKATLWKQINQSNLNKTMMNGGSFAFKINWALSLENRVLTLYFAQSNFESVNEMTTLCPSSTFNIFSCLIVFLFCSCVCVFLLPCCQDNVLLFSWTELNLIPASAKGVSLMQKRSTLNHTAKNKTKQKTRYKPL